MPPGTIRIHDDRAELWLAEAGRIELTRDPLTISFATRATLSPEALLHPFLGLPAAIANSWLGRSALHAGAFVHRECGWALLGNREAGKSATLAHLIQTGHDVLSDDILIIEGTTVFAGPRSVDLREEAAAVVGGEPLGVVGNRARWRVRPAPSAPSIRLGGLVHLAWGESVSVQPLDADTRLRQLISSSVLRPGPAEALELLELAALPAWRFTRPRALDGLAAATEALLAELAP